MSVCIVGLVVYNSIVSEPHAMLPSSLHLHLHIKISLQNESLDSFGTSQLEIEQDTCPNADMYDRASIPQADDRVGSRLQSHCMQVRRAVLLQLWNLLSGWTAAMQVDV